MKRILLVLSLAGNLVLAYTLARQDPASARIASPPAPLTGSSRSLSGISAEQAAALNLTPVEAEALRRSFTGISHVDLRTYVQNLRAAGCPPDLLRLLVRAQAADPSAGTSGQLQRERLSKPYWKYSEFTKEALETANAEYKAQRALLKELLGPEEMYEQSVENTLRQHRGELGGVPEEKRSHVRALLRDYDELTNEIFQQAIAPGGPGRVILLPEESERLAYLQEQKWKDLQALLTTSEFEDYAVRSSGTANFLRSQVPASIHPKRSFDPSSVCWLRPPPCFRPINSAPPPASPSFTVNSVNSSRSSWPGSLPSAQQTTSWRPIHRRARWPDSSRNLNCRCPLPAPSPQPRPPHSSAPRKSVATPRSPPRRAPHSWRLSLPMPAARYRRFWAATAGWLSTSSAGAETG